MLCQRERSPLRSRPDFVTHDALYVVDTPLEPVIGLAKGETGGGYDDQLRSDAVGAAYNQSCGSVGTSPEASTRSQPAGARACCGRKAPFVSLLLAASVPEPRQTERRP